MKQSKNNNITIFYSEINCVRKTAEKSASEVFEDNGVKQWITGNFICIGIK